MWKWNPGFRELCLDKLTLGGFAKGRVTKCQLICFDEGGYSFTSQSLIWELGTRQAAFHQHGAIFFFMRVSARSKQTRDLKRHVLAGAPFLTWHGDERPGSQQECSKSRISNFRDVFIKNNLKIQIQPTGLSPVCFSCRFSDLKRSSDSFFTKYLKQQTLLFRT